MALAPLAVVEGLAAVVGSPVLLLLRYRYGARPAVRVADFLRYVDGGHLLRSVVRGVYVAPSDTARHNNMGVLFVAVPASV